MKRIFLFLLTFCITSVVAFAQSMTDNQVVDYVKQRNEAGANQTTIVTELLERGATRDQLLRIKEAYESRVAKTGKNSKSSTTSQEDIDRQRVNNGEPMVSDDPYEDLELDLNQDEDVYSDTKQKSKTKTKTNTKNSKTNTKGKNKDEEWLWEEEDEESPQIYGHDIFRTKLLSFEPNMSIAVPESYILGPGDEVIVDVYGNSQRSEKLKVAPDGTVTTMYGGPVNVGGKTLGQATSAITGRLRQFYSGSKIKVTIGQTRAITVHVMGEVKIPGSYTLSAFATVFHALYHAGGVNDLGTLREIKVSRHGHVISTVDVYDYILNGRLTGNVMLEDNDVILVDTYKNLVEVTGEVKRPMHYELKSGESLRTVLDYAGGFKGGAYTEVVTVERTRNTEAYVYSPNEDEFTQFTMHDGDVVTVSRTDTHFTNVAFIKGAVYRPGRYEIGETAQTVRTLIEQAGGLKEDALRTRAILLRMKSDRSREAMTIDLDGIMAGTSIDIPLKNEDELTISSRERELKDQKLTIEGEVFNPGTYNYATNMKVEDLITMAGGLKESASLLNVEVSRRIVNQEGAADQEQKAEIFNVKIKEGLQIDTANTFSLLPYDRVFVRKSPAYSQQLSVWIGGEVLFSGLYTLESQSERLSDIVKRTGGFTSKASVRDARLKRRMNETELLRRAKLIQRADAASDSINISKLDLNETYYVGIDLQEAINNPGGSADLVLRDGDELIIPQLENTVKINGEVLYPNTVTFIEGKKLSYYINQAGGYTKEAQNRQAYIIYNNGNVSRASKGRVQPGCEIVVPTKKHKENSKNIATTLSVSTTLASIVAVLVTALK